MPPHDDLDVSVAVDDALAFVKEWETLRRQRQKRGALDIIEEFADLLSSRAGRLNARRWSGANAPGP